MAKINVSIDDISPHPMSSTSVLKQCFKVIDRFPEVKFTLFIPIAYWRTVGHTATSEPLSIDKFPNFCHELLTLPASNFELAFHGLRHGVPGRSNNDEFQDVSFEEALQIVDKMIEVTTNAGLISVFKKVLRPPAWRMSPGAFAACESRGISTFALSPDDYAMATYKGAQQNRRVVYYTCCPPSKPLQLEDKTEIVYHACEWDRNALTDTFTDELINFLLKHEGKYEFCFIEDLLDVHETEQQWVNRIR